MLVLIGPHGAGKTTLGEALAQRTGWPFHDEIGRRLAADDWFRPRDRTAADPDAAFDDAVFRRELERDCTAPKHRIVETWHPGNLAYARARGSDSVRKYAQAVRLACGRCAGGVIFVDAHRDTLLRRQSERGDVDFFVRVARAAERFARALGLPVIARVRTDVDDASTIAARLMSSHFRGARSA